MNIQQKIPQIYKQIKLRLPEYRQQIISAAQKTWLAVKKYARELADLIVRMISIFLRKNVPRAAAEMSFHIIFSIFPLLICVHWFVGLLHLNYDDTIVFLREFLPMDTVNIIVDYLEYIAKYQSNALLYAGIFMLLMPSSAAIRALKNIINSVNNRSRNSQSIWDFFLSFGAAIVFLLVVYACIFVLFTGEKLLLFLVNTLDIGKVILTWRWLRFLVLFVVLSVVLYLLYRFLPYSIHKSHLLFQGKVMPGVLFSSLTLVGVSILFSWFIGLSTRYSLIYGSLASIIIFMLWLYTCCSIVILGSIVNVAVNEKKRMDYFISPKIRAGLKLIKK